MCDCLPYAMLKKQKLFYLETCQDWLLCCFVFIKWELWMSSEITVLTHPQYLLKLDGKKSNCFALLMSSTNYPGVLSLRPYFPRIKLFNAVRLPVCLESPFTFTNLKLGGWSSCPWKSSRDAVPLRDCTHLVDFLVERLYISLVTKFSSVSEPPIDTHISLSLSMDREMDSLRSLLCLSLSLPGTSLKLSNVYRPWHIHKGKYDNIHFGRTRYSSSNNNNTF